MTLSESPSDPYGTVSSDGETRASWMSRVWVLVAGLAILAFVLGLVGFRELHGDRYPWTELVYRTLQLFVLESGALEQPGARAPVTLELARILAPAVAAYAAIRALVVLFRTQLALLGMRFRLRNHVVIAGLGGQGFALAKSFRAAKHRVVVIEKDPNNPAIPGCRERAIAVLTGDAADPALLLRSRVPRARYLIVVAGENRTNINIVFSAARLARARHGPPMTALVHLDDPALWRLLAAQILALPERPPFRIEFFNVKQAAARLLLEAHPPFDPSSPGGRAHLLVVGMGGMAENVVLYAATMWQRADPAPAEPLRITVAGEHAVRQRESLLSRFPGLSHICELIAWETEIETLAHEAPESLPPARPPFTAIYVCLDEEAAGLAAALALRNRADTRDVPTVLTVEDEDSGVAIALRGEGRLAPLQPFGILSRTLTPDLLLHGTNEILAQAKHEHYVRCEHARGRSSVEENSSLAPWHELDETLKESNRMFADSIGAKLEAAGCAIVPMPLAASDGPLFSFTDDEVEELARSEHDRWWNDLVRAGWRLGPVKDPKATPPVHPKLVPWSELTEEDRDKDREPVRALPEMLASVGFAVQRATDAGPPDEPPRDGARGDAGSEPRSVTGERR